ncbi:MAG: hypothetical protein KDB60_09160 [Propionibacteriaceae bacterium]|nr:hypothetical protein [Propionibacteriaceae bacterium]
MAVDDPVGLTRPPGWPELPDGDELVLWRGDDYGANQCGLAWGDSVVLDGSVLRVIDPATGAERAAFRSATLGIERVGSSLVGTGFTGLARLDLPR